MGKMTFKGQPNHKFECFYDGEWVNNKKNGIGKMQFGNGRMREVKFKDDMFVGPHSDSA